MHGIAKKDWCLPSDDKQREHYKEIRRVLGAPTGPLQNSTNWNRESTTAAAAPRPTAPTEVNGNKVTADDVGGPAVPV